MSTIPAFVPGCTCAACLEAFGLHTSVIALLPDVGGGDDDPALFVELRIDGSATVTDVGRADPAALLIGRRAESDVAGVAVLTPASVAASAASYLPTGADLLVVHQVMADGTTRCFARVDRGVINDGPTIEPTQSLLSTQCAGTQFDLLLRYFNLPTAAPALPVEWYWIAVWLSDLASFPSFPGLEEAARWYPGIHPRDLDVLPDVDLERYITRKHRLHSRANGWSGLRGAAAEGWIELGFCPAELAAWLDDGAFARWLADQIPWPEELAIWADHNLSGRTRQLVLDLLDSCEPRIGTWESG